jgi:uncharacterized glyoxalase superfamily protein PhnB
VPVLCVRDVEASARFFRDRLGFNVDFLHGDPPFYGSVSRDGAVVHLKFVHERVVIVAEDDREGFISAFIHVANVEALHVEYVAAGVSFDQKLQKQPWGHDFIVRDIDGNSIAFAQPETAVSRTVNFYAAREA